ncbi:hypothetical protein GCM10027043_49720 [Ferruginibacter profundus]
MKKPGPLQKERVPDFYVANRKQMPVQRISHVQLFAQQYFYKRHLKKHTNTNYETKSYQKKTAT